MEILSPKTLKMSIRKANDGIGREINGKKLNLGCGGDIKPKSEGWINLDRYKSKNVDIVHNLDNFPYPFKDNTFAYIYASHTLEHLKADWDKIIRELYRILKSEGIIEMIVPHIAIANSASPHHYKYFSWCCFSTIKNPGQKDLQVLNTFKGFRIENKRLECNPKNPLKPIFDFIANLKPNIFERTFLVYLLPPEQIRVILKKLN